MPKHYLRYTMPYFYRTEFQGPKDSLTLMGQPGITGVCSVQALITKHRPAPGDDGHATYTWEIIRVLDGSYMDQKGSPVIQVARSSTSFTSQHGAALNADDYIGRHHHTSVIHDGPVMLAITSSRTCIPLGKRGKRS